MKKKIKILHIISSLKTGGAEALFCDILKHMSSNYEHVVIYFHDGQHAQCLQHMNIELHQVSGLITLYDPVFFINLRRLFKKIKPDIIHTQLWAANNIGRILGHKIKVPVISVLHNYLDQDGTFKNMIDRHTTKYADQFIAYTHEIAQSLLKRDSWIPVQKIKVLPIGIDIKTIHQKASGEKRERSDLNLNEKHFIIGSVGRFVPVRRYDLMIDAFKIVQDAYAHTRLILVGVGPLEYKLREQTRKLGIEDKVTFLIDQPGYRYYGLFDCFSLTSDKEGPSLALLEALSFGVPCVRTNSELSHPVIKNENNGLLVRAGNVYELAQAYIRIIENQNFSKMLGENAKHTILEKYDICTTVKQFEKIVISIMSNN